VIELGTFADEVWWYWCSSITELSTYTGVGGVSERLLRNTSRSCIQVALPRTL
jgi:hypothetical protein